MILNTFIPLTEALHQLTQADVFLYSTDLKLVYSNTSNKKSPMTFFKGLPKTANDCIIINVQDDAYLVSKIGDFLGYLIVGPFTGNLTALASLMVNINREPPIRATLKTEQVTLPEPFIKPNETVNANKIVNTYIKQNQMMDRIANGNVASLSIVQSLETTPFLNRVPQQKLRSAKNILFVLNTLCRVAAERGNVNAVLLDRISGELAVHIEKLASVASADAFAAQMPKRYAELVRERKRNNYSTDILAVIDHINLHYQETLTLADLAKLINANPDYLSRKFRNETGERLFSFINQYRVQMAKYQLVQKDTTIVSIAVNVGFNSLTYFNRIFKRYTGQTPREFAEAN